MKLIAFCLVLSACNPELAAPAANCSDSAADEAALSVTLEPAAPLEAAPPILRLHVAGGADPQRLVLVEGEVGSSHLGQIARDDISKALAERIVPALVWAEGEQLVLAPNRVLAAGPYSLASGAPKVSVPIVVAEDDPLPHLALTFPPEGASAGPRLGVWCGSMPLAPLELPIELSPTGEDAILTRGAVHETGSSCAHLETGAAGIDPVVAPPALTGEDGQIIARVDPVALHGGVAVASWSPRVCQADEVAFGPGCARVLDDRMFIAPPDAPLLWSISANGIDAVMQSDGAPMLLSSLTPSTLLTLAVSVLDIGGRVEHDRAAIQTMAPMAHVVVNEVLANPMGPEPEQEWVELYNDGLAPAQLSSYTLGDGGGAVSLAALELPPGGYALVVNEAFDALSTSDPSPVEGTLIVRVPELCTNGLSNEGEPLTLFDHQGVLVSRFAATPKPKAGKSVMRVTPKAIDELESSFVLSPDLPTPGAPN